MVRSVTNALLQDLHRPMASEVLDDSRRRRTSTRAQTRQALTTPSKPVHEPYKACSAITLVPSGLYIAECLTPVVGPACAAAWPPVGVKLTELV